jgi:hypothetical protein
MAKKNNELGWRALEYDYHERSPDWFWAVGIITIALSITAVILHDVLFALVIVLSGFVLSLYAARPPKEIDITLNEKGVRVEKVFYPYHTLESFWLEENETSSRILIKSQRLVMPYIILPIGDADPEDVHEYLLHHLPEVFHSESVFHKLMEYIGF